MTARLILKKYSIFYQNHAVGIRLMIHYFCVNGNKNYGLLILLYRVPRICIQANTESSALMSMNCFYQSFSQRTLILSRKKITQQKTKWTNHPLPNGLFWPSI